MAKRKYPEELIRYIMEKRGIKYRSAVSFIKRHNLKTLEDAQKLLEGEPPKVQSANVQTESENENANVQSENEHEKVQDENVKEEQHEEIQTINGNVNQEFKIENQTIARLLKGENEKAEESTEEKKKFNPKFAARLIEVIHRIAYRLSKSIFNIQFENDEQDLKELIAEVQPIWIEEMEKWGVQVDNNTLILVIIYGSYFMRLKRIEKPKEGKKKKTPAPVKVENIPDEVQTENESAKVQSENEYQNEHVNMFKVEDIPEYAG